MQRVLLDALEMHDVIYVLYRDMQRQSRLSGSIYEPCLDASITLMADESLMAESPFRLQRPLSVVDAPYMYQSSGSPEV